MIPLLLALGFLATGCASLETPTAHAEMIQAIQATGEIPQDQLIDVGIKVFDPGLPAEGEELPEDVFPELREAEARFLAIRLMNTMQATGQWGAVRVLPGDHGFTDLKVSATILVSTGMRLALDVQAVDATGREWFDRRYRGEADGFVYVNTERGKSDPYQSLYNEISNDILKARQRFKAKQLNTIRQVSRMQFAANVAPVPFGNYLTTDRKGRVSTTRLPANDDPMMRRIDGIRGSENLFVDTLDQYYAAYFERMTGPYDSWRKYTYEEERAYRALKRKAMTQKILGGLAILGAVLTDTGSHSTAVVRDLAVFGGLAAIHAGMATSEQAKIHAEALRELGGSVETELEPIVIQVEGQTHRLTGTAETQFQEWRRLLQEIWATETGLPQDLNQPAAPGPEGESSAPGRRHSESL
ncbi:MAG: hypothetical protein GY906_09405 [bacterium]|nr:hypothetical protein [bacterium]